MVEILRSFTIETFGRSLRDAFKTMEPESFKILDEGACSITSDIVDLANVMISGCPTKLHGRSGRYVPLLREP
jgi:hypothetical protein